MTLPLTKTMDLADLEQLTEELAIVNKVGLDGQTPEARRWEYAMALRAQQVWYDTTDGRRPQGPVIDVGGAGSPFWRMINRDACRVVDPNEGDDLAEHLRQGASLASEVYCLSVLEHVDDLDQFLYHLSCLVAPGGLLFLTMDCWDRRGCPDTAHFYWMRKRIFEVPGWIDLALPLRDFTIVGDYDLRYHDHQLYGSYSVASLALMKRTR